MVNYCAINCANLFRCQKPDSQKFFWLNPSDCSVKNSYSRAIDNFSDIEKQSLSRKVPTVNRYRQKRPKVDASIFDSALSDTRRSDVSEKREENSVSTFGRFRPWTSFESSPESVKLESNWKFREATSLWRGSINWRLTNVWAFCFCVIPLIGWVAIPIFEKWGWVTFELDNGFESSKSMVRKIVLKWDVKNFFLENEEIQKSKGLLDKILQIYAAPQTRFWLNIACKLLSYLFCFISHGIISSVFYLGRLFHEIYDVRLLRIRDEFDGADHRNLGFFCVYRWNKTNLDDARFEIK